MSNEITFSFKPSSLDEALRHAKILSSSKLVPAAYKGCPEDILVAIQMGGEVGLSPLQALQGIAVINGRATLYGDSMIALVQAHPDCEDIQERIEGDTAICRVKRRGQEWYEKRFSVEDAKKANLWGKAGPWSSYPERMLQMRARGFALRDKFSDALRGLISFEEANDYASDKKMVDVTPPVDNSPMTEEHIQRLRDLLDELNSREDKLGENVFTSEEKMCNAVASKFDISLEGTLLESFPDCAFKVLEPLLIKKCQMVTLKIKEKEDKENLLHQEDPDPLEELISRGDE